MTMRVVHDMACSADPPRTLCGRVGWLKRYADRPQDVTCKQCLSHTGVMDDLRD